MQGEKRGREVGGRGRTGQTEAAEESHQLHPGAAERAGAAVRRDALPGRVHEGGAEPAAGPVRGPGAGEGVAPAAQAAPAASSSSTGVLCSKLGSGRENDDKTKGINQSGNQIIIQKKKK